ncbi:MAG TPA: phage tail protein [bacterium]
MDANGTRYQLLLGREDWDACCCAALDTDPRGAWLPPRHGDAPLEWNADTCEVLLRAKPFVHTPAPRDARPDLERDRRGAAVDMFGNWYWVDETRSRIRVRSAGTELVSDFWPVPASTPTCTPGGFRAAETSPPPTGAEFGGLAVTSDHFLVAGTRAPAGVLVFDLFAGGPPEQLTWPAGVNFVPWDLAAGPDGGLCILDRENQRYWSLDRRFEVVCTPESRVVQEEADQTFQPVEGEARRKIFRRTFPIGIDVGGVSTVGANAPAAIEVLADGTVLILDGPASGSAGFSKILVFRDGAFVKNLDLKKMSDRVDPAVATSFSLVGYDMAFVGTTALAGHSGVLYVADAGGNQGYAFRLSIDGKGDWQQQALSEYLPMRRFGGKALVVFGGTVYYDFAEAWVPLVQQYRPRYQPEAWLDTRHLDGGEPDCVWHRLLLDACIPSGSRVEIWSRAANSPELLEAAPWLKEPPLYLRGDGSELPFLQQPWSTSSGARGRGDGTWELLLQRAQGRYLQVRIRLVGQERSTPRLRALRVYYPRFSYLNEYLPAVYREDQPSAKFLDGFLANVEGICTSIEDRIAAAHVLFDWRSAPAEALEWLGSWLGVALDPAWNEERRRLFIRHAMLFFQYRGTAHGLRLALSLALGPQVDESRFAVPERVGEERFGVRIIEKYLTRKLPDVLFGDPAQLEAPAGADELRPWRPADGRDALRRRYARLLGLPTNAPLPEFPLVPPVDRQAAGLWSLFCEQVLGFTPWAAGLEREAWQRFLEARYESLDKLHDAWQAPYQGFEEILQPTNQPQDAVVADDWARHMRQADPLRTPGERLDWQSFLRGRHGAVSQLNAKYSTAWAAYDLVPLPDTLPPDGPALEDWFQFEAAFLAIRGTAHRFSVLLPMPTDSDSSPAEPGRRLELARRIVGLEKPAHTVFDVRFYWAMFLVGQARLGRDTQVELGIRERLLHALVLDHGYVGEGYLSPAASESRSERQILGRNRLDH